MVKYEDNFLGQVGGEPLRPIPGVSLTVTNVATDLEAQLYSDDGVTPLAQPITTDINGYFGFHVADGKYRLRFAKAGMQTINRFIVVDDPSDNPYLTQAAAAAPTGAAQVGFLQAGTGAVARTVKDKIADSVSIKDFGAVGDGITDNYEAINKALAASATVEIPAGIFLTSAGSTGKPSHVITGKCLIGVSREVSVIKATGLNEGRTLFVNDQTDIASPGTWGSGRDFRLENLWIRGNWDAVSGLTSVTEGSATTNVGILKANYDATQTALVKGVSAAYPFIINCYVDNAYEHGVLFYRAGYCEISGNIIARCRGSGLWLTADSAASAITSTVVERNQIVANRGGYGGLYTKFTYGCAFRDNRPFEDNTWGATFGEGADTDISGNYFEINPFGDASIDPSIWGLSLVNNYWTIVPTLPSGGSMRGFFGYDRKIGLQHRPVSGLGETDNRLGPVRYSSDSSCIGVSTPPAASGAGLTFPATQVPSTDPDTLDDYKERSVTLTDASGAGLAFTGAVVQTKIGRKIFISGQLTFPTTASTAAVSIGGIPTVGSTGAIGVIGDNAGLGASVVLASAAATNFSIYPAGSFTNRTNANMSGKVIYFMLSYIAA